jgi:hypothetical protein
LDASRQQRYEVTPERRLDWFHELPFQPFGQKQTEQTGPNHSRRDGQFEDAGQHQSDTDKSEDVFQDYH